MAKSSDTTKVVALAGGVGGAKLAHGLAAVMPPECLTVIVNTGDDFEHYGLCISPDLDTVCYTLAGMANLQTGWGRKGETWQAYEDSVLLGGPAWFHLGDRDLGTHLERTRRLALGQPLSRVTADFCRAWGVTSHVFPMTDHRVATVVQTVEYGELPFQNYFVEHQSRPQVTGFRFEGIEAAVPAPGVLDAIQEAGYIVVCPSNPWVSIQPILNLKGIHEALAGKAVVAVSPIIGGQALKGPAAKMFSELGIRPSASAVARFYEGLLAGFVFDRTDAEQADDIYRSGIIPYVTDTIMTNEMDRRRLAGEVADFAARLVMRRENRR